MLKSCNNVRGRRNRLIIKERKRMFNLALSDCVTVYWFYISELFYIDKPIGILN